MTPVHAAGSATGEARNEARSLADQGADAYAREDFAGAHELFVRAYALVPAPTIALFEARALVQLKRLLDARAAYVRASSAPLSSDAPVSHREAVREAEAELLELDRRIPRYRVIVEGNAGSISMDGRPLPKNSVDSWLRGDPGAHELRFSDASGKRSLVRFELHEGDAKTLRIDSRGDSPSPARTIGFVSLGIGAAGLAIGASAGLIAIDAHRDAKRRCSNETCVPGSSGADALERFEDYRTLSTVGYGIGAAGAVAGAILVLGSLRESKPRVALATSLHAVRLEATF